MTDLLQEFCDSRGLALRVDRAVGVIRGIKILGLHSRNGREYLPEALGRAVSLYEGAKVNVNHPKGHPLSPRDYQERIGVIRNIQHRPAEGLFADFHFNPKHHLSEQLMWDAEHAPENVGFSHNVQARTSRRGETTLVEEILRVHGVDLVADPATTRGLFEAAGAAAPSPSQGEGWGEGGGMNNPASAESSESSRAGQSLAVQEHSAASVQEHSAAGVQEHGADLFEKLCREQAAEISKLRLEIDRFRAIEAAHERQSKMRALLAEYHLPDPDATDPAAKAIVSETFVRSLLTAADEPGMRRLIEERARLIGCVRSVYGGPGDAWPARQRPTSRDQVTLDPKLVLDGRTFARAIAG